MPVAEFRFRRATRRRASRAQVQDTAEAFLVALEKNGQIEGDWVLAWKGDILSAWCEAPAADSLDERNDSPWVTEALGKVAAAFGSHPRFRFHGDTMRLRSPSWRTAKSLLLFTHAFDRQSPVCRSGDLAAIPLYTLPLEPPDRQDLLFWAREYRDLDHLWLACGPLELAAYRQLAEVHRPLLIEGRRLARLIEERTSRPTFTFVHRYYGRKREEGNRRCPFCGRRWKRQAGHFPFGCDPCRLVSDEAVEFDEPRLARIGDFVPSSPPAGSPRSTPRRAR